MRWKCLRCALMVLSSFSLASLASAATPIFLSDTDGVGPTSIFLVDQSTGQLTPIVSLPASLGEVIALAAASDNLLYAVAEGGDVMQITVNPPDVATLGNIGINAVSGLAMSSDGTLYAIDEGTDQLSVLQLSPLAQIVVGTVHLGSPGGPVFDIQGGDLAEDAAGNWFLWTNATESLYRLDVANAVVTPIDAATSGLGFTTGLAFDYQGGNALLASSRSLDALLTLDPSTGLPSAQVYFCLPPGCPCATPPCFGLQFGDLASPRCTDADHDGFSPEGGPCGPIDCNDNDPNIHPGAPERCNGIDDDCNGIIDDSPAADASCSDGNLCNGSELCRGGVCQPGTPLACDTCQTCDPSAGCTGPPCTATPTPTATFSSTSTQAPTLTATASWTATGSATPTQTPTLTATETPTNTPVPIETATQTATQTPTSPSTPSPTASATDTPVATATTPPSLTSTVAPSLTPTASTTATPTDSATPTPSGTPTPSEVPPSATPPPTATATSTETPTALPSVTPTVTPSETPTSTTAPTATPTATTIPATLTPTPTALDGISGQILYYSNAAPVSAATVQRLGGPAAQAETDLTGSFTLAAGLGNTWEIEPQKSGDAGTAIGALDAVYVLQSVVGTRTLNAEQQLACDVSGDGAISVLDAVLILQYAVGMISTFPAAQACGSDWVFVPVPAPAPNQVIVQPQLSASRCQPGAIAFQPLAAPMFNRNFSAALFGDCTGDWQQDGRAGGGAILPMIALAQPAGRAGRLRRGRKGQLRLPLYVESGVPFNALDVEVRYDPERLDAIAARPLSAARGALVQLDAEEPGVLRLGLASAEPIESGGKPVLLIAFRGRDRFAAITPVVLSRLRVDEQPATVIGR